MKYFTRSLLLILLVLNIFTSCSVNKAKIDNDIKSYFDQKSLEGCFTMLDNSSGEITVYNMSMDTIRYSPGATFDILHTLIALQTGAVINENTPFHTNDTSTLDTNKLTIKDAFKQKSDSVFAKIYTKIGKAAMQNWLDSIAYGNKKIGTSVASFWNNNTLKISPDEQLGFMKKLYFDQLPFRKSVQLSVREMMLQEDNSAYKFSYRTGNAFDEQLHPVEWLIGWIEENRHVYFLSAFVKYPNASNHPEEALPVTKKILEHYAFFKGTK